MSAQMAKILITVLVLCCSLNVWAYQNIVSGSASYEETKEVYPGLSNASIWGPMCSLAKRRAEAKAIAVCDKLSNNSSPDGEFANSGKCSGFILGVGYKIKVHFDCK